MPRYSTRSFAFRAAGFLRICISVVVVGGAVTACAPGVDAPKPTVIAPTVKVADPRLIELAEKAIDESRYSDAKLLLERVFLADLKSAKAKLLLAELHLATGLTQQSVGEFDRLKGESEVSARALQGKGIALLVNGDNDGAHKALKQAVDKQPTLWRAWNALAYLFDMRQDWKDSEASYGKALAASPRSAMVFNNRGYSRLIQRRVDDAIGDLTRAVRLDPTFHVARLNLRLALAWKGEFAHAAVGSAGNEMGKTLNNVGYMAMLRGDYGAAESYFMRAMDVDAGFNKVAWRNLGYLKSLKEMQSIRSGKNK